MQEYSIEFQGVNILAIPPKVCSVGDGIILGIGGGPGLSNEYFKSFIYSLKAETYTLAILDLPGHGGSTDSPQDYNELIQHLTPLVGFLATRFGHVFLVGHSFGARICFWSCPRQNIHISQLI